MGVDKMSATTNNYVVNFSSAHLLELSAPFFYSYVGGSVPMIEVQAVVFKKNFGKYMALALEEEIAVIKKGKVMFYTRPPRLEALKEYDDLVGCLPSDASIGEDSDERG